MPCYYYTRLCGSSPPHHENIPDKLLRSLAPLIEIPLYHTSPPKLRRPLIPFTKFVAKRHPGRISYYDPLEPEAALPPLATAIIEPISALSLPPHPLSSSAHRPVCPSHPRLTPALYRP